MATANALDFLLTGARSVPFGIRVRSSTIAAVGVGVAELSTKPISHVSLDGASLTRAKAVSIAIFSKELIELGGEGIDDFVAGEVRRGLSQSTDRTLLPALIAAAGATPATTGAAAADLEALLGSLPFHSEQKLAWIGAPDVAIKLSVLQLAGLPSPVPIAGSGGSLLDAPFLVSAELSDGTLVLLDADALVGAGEDMAQHFLTEDKAKQLFEAMAASIAPQLRELFERLEQVEARGLAFRGV
jgi:hypothetical protein